MWLEVFIGAKGTAEITQGLQEERKEFKDLGEGRRARKGEKSHKRDKRRTKKGFSRHKSQKSVKKGDPQY